MIYTGYVHTYIHNIIATRLIHLLLRYYIKVYSAKFLFNAVDLSMSVLQAAKFSLDNNVHL